MIQTLEPLKRIAMTLAACERVADRQRFFSEADVPAFVESVVCAFQGGAGAALRRVAGSTEAASRALSLASTVREAITLTRRVVDADQKGETPASRWRAIRADAVALRCGGGETAILPALVSASLWSRLERHADPMPARRPIVAGFEGLAEYIWRNRNSLDLPSPPPLPVALDWDSSAKWSAAAVRYAREGIARIESMPPPPRGSEILAIIASAAQGIAHEFGLRDSFDKNLLSPADEKMSPFGQFYFCLYDATRALVVGQASARSHVFPAHITPSKAYDYLC